MTRTIGLIGGMSWESSAEYHRLLNEGVRRRLGGHHCARVVLHSVDFAEIEAMRRSGDWAAAGPRRRGRRHLRRAHPGPGRLAAPTWQAGNPHRGQPGATGLGRRAALLEEGIVEWRSAGFPIAA